MKKLTTIILFFFGCLSAIAQHSVSGKITDEHNQTIPFANIILHQKDTKKTPKGVVSDDDGNYIFENISDGKYQIEVSVLGFKIKKSEVFLLSANKTFNFTLKEESQTLDEVVIKAKRPVIKQTAEKLIVDLEKSDLPNSNLQDVMRRVPGILVTNNGISVAGKTGIRILINGKTTEYMDIQTLLRDLPADNIAKVEVIEQPGAEHDASGSGAIINIILKKNVQLGTHGSVNLWMGKDEGFEYGTSASIASYKNKLNWQASAGYSEPTWRDDLFLKRTVNNEIYDQKTKSPFNPVNYRVSASVDYYINDKNSIGIGSSWRKRLSEEISTSNTQIIQPLSTKTLNSQSTNDRNRANFNINPYYEFKSDTDKFVLDFNYIKYNNKNTNNIFDIAGTTENFTDRRYIQDGKFTVKTYKGDYSKSFSDTFKLSIGSKYSQVNTDSDLQALLENKNTNKFDFLNDGSNRFLIDETIFAVYSKINTSFGKWSFSGGLRYENSKTTGTSTNPAKTNTRDIKKLFPSASISRQITDKLGANVSYSYRIRRPSYSSLNAFENFLDPFSADVGNPELKPAFTNNYQFNLTFDKQPFFTIGYSQTKDVIFELIQQDNATAQIRQRDVNVENAKNWNFRLFAPLSFIKGVEGYAGVVVVHKDYQSKLYDFAINRWDTYAFMQANYTLPLDIDFQLSANYGTGALEGQIEADWIAGLDFSFSKKFMDKRLKASLGFNKMLNRGFNGKIDYGNGNATVESNGSRQNIQLKLTYSFGSKFGKKKSKRNSSKDEENRIQN